MAVLVAGTVTLTAPLPDASLIPEPVVHGEPHSQALACLAMNIYWEARSEKPDGQMAVAAVTLNRVGHEEFPDTVCGVVKQGGERRNQCQFSWWCDGRKDIPDDPAAWHRARLIARNALEGKLADPTAGALYYHAAYVTPLWADGKKRTARIGRHVFYTAKKPSGLAGGVPAEPSFQTALLGGP